ncbi:acyl-CoA dehydrogenase, partial [Bacillus haynesii]|nr:acyl-CoA dehydrogenase [Bacillus haynesii]
YGKAIDQEQEILVNIADIVSQVYAMEAAILRTEKAIQATGEAKNAQKILYTQIFAQEAFQEIESHAKESLIAMESGDSLRMMLSALRKLTRFTPVNVIEKKRQAAKEVFEAEKYIV